MRLRLTLLLPLLYNTLTTAEIALLTGTVVNLLTQSWFKGADPISEIGDST